MTAGRKPAPGDRQLERRQGPNAINFNIPGSGMQTINLLSALPTISQPVTIDGTTEPNSGGKPVIQIDGTKAGAE